MKIFVLVSMLILQVFSTPAQEKSTQPLEVVPSVDLTRYMGTWYEVARLPNWFQKQCTGNVSATYVLQEDGTIKVLNRCQKEDGQMTEAVGRAKPASNKGPNTKLKVRFAPAFLSFLPFVWGDYWIIDLAPDYSHVVVGEPSRKYLWVLSRTPVMDENALQNVLEKVRAMGYNLASLIRTERAAE